MLNSSFNTKTAFVVMGALAGFLATLGYLAISHPKNQPEMYTAISLALMLEIGIVFAKTEISLADRVRAAVSSAPLGFIVLRLISAVRYHDSDFASLLVYTAAFVANVMVIIALNRETTTTGVSEI